MIGLSFNKLEIKGPEKNVSLWVQDAASDPRRPLSLEAFYPIPKPIQAQFDQLHWKAENWGTPREAIFIEPLLKGDSPNPETFSSWKGGARYGFQTAGGPPLGWLQKVAKNYPELSFQLSYTLPASGQSGEYVWKDGQLISETP